MEQYSGKDLNEALQIASEAKGCNVDELKYRMVSSANDDASGCTIEAYCMDDIKEFLFDYLGGFFSEIDPDGIEMEISLNREGDGWDVNIASNNNAVYIGKGGATLKAINTVVNAAVQGVFKHRYPIFVDINHYKHHRYSRLVRTAKNIAKNVQRSHVDAQLDPMPNDERKVIHQALANWHNLSTASEGEGKDRHIVLRYVEDEVVDLGDHIDLSDDDDDVTVEIVELLKEPDIDD